MHNNREERNEMKFEEIRVEFEKYSSLDVIAESPDPAQQTTTAYSNEGTNDPYFDDPF